MVLASGSPSDAKLRTHTDSDLARRIVLEAAAPKCTKGLPQTVFEMGQMLRQLLNFEILHV
eukprot:1492242-Prorocentrum_lima.AAC.1